MTHPDTTSQQSFSADASSTSGTSGASGLSEDSDSPPDAHADLDAEPEINSEISPEISPDTDWISPAQNQVENNIADARWKVLLQSGQPLCIALLDKFAKMTKISNCTISVLWTDDSEMAGINNQFRQQDKPTNILSFPAHDNFPDTLPEEPIFLGDMALGFETLTNEAADNGQLVEHHLAHLFLHGLLHLVGYDHQDEAEAEEMEALEIQLLAEMNIPNPYLLKPTIKKEDNDHV